MFLLLRLRFYFHVPVIFSIVPGACLAQQSDIGSVYLTILTHLFKQIRPRKMFFKILMYT